MSCCAVAIDCGSKAFGNIVWGYHGCGLWIGLRREKPAFSLMRRNMQIGQAAFDARKPSGDDFGPWLRKACSAFYRRKSV
jgi:hypothetical protein